MTKGARDFGQFLAATHSIPESLQIARLTGRKRKESCGRRERRGRKTRAEHSAAPNSDRHYSRSTVGLTGPNQPRLPANHENQSRAAAMAMTSEGMTAPEGPMTWSPPLTSMV
jgi:hypothetical protein